MNSQEISNNNGAVVRIPHKLHYYHFQKLTFKKTSSPMIPKNSLCSKNFQIMLHNKLNKNLKKTSNRILKNLKSTSAVSNLTLRYAFSNPKEITSIADTIKHLKGVSTLQLRIMNESIDLERLNILSRSFCYLQNLKALDLIVTYSNSTRTKEFKLAQALKSFKNLQTLCLNFGWGGVVNLSKVCDGLKFLTHLTSFTFLQSSSGVTDNEAIILADGLAHLKNLQQLKVDLSYNRITAFGLNYVIQSLKELTHLEELELAFNGNVILVDDLVAFKDSIQNLSQLKVLKLNFSNMKIFQNSIKDFGDGLSHLKNLKRLQLGFLDCRLSEKHIINLGKGIAELTSLTELDIDMENNQLQDKETLEFIECLRPLKEMKKFSLSLSRNLVGDWVLYTISKILANYRNLESIQLGGFSCKLSDKGIEKLCVFAERLYNLKELTLIFNKNTNIQDEGVKKLMDKLTEAKGLKEIRIDFLECKLSQELEDFYREKLQNELPQCQTTILFGY